MNCMEFISDEKGNRAITVISRCRFSTARLTSGVEERWLTSLLVRYHYCYRGIVSCSVAGESNLDFEHEFQWQ